MTSMSVFRMLRSLRRAPPGADEAHAWPRYIWLMFLVFLFMPALFHEHPPIHGHPPDWLRPTLLTLPVFCVLYVLSTRQSGRSMLPALLGTALLDYVLFPLNPFANVYLIYTAALLPFALAGFVRPLLVTLTLLALHITEACFLGHPLVSVAFTALLSIGCCLGNSAMVESRLKTEALQLSHQEIRRLATLAERERIGRDLHDLLGHTLSLIAIKSELAGKLLVRDREAAAAEVADVTRIARDALKQVRTAVTGMRTAALEGEFASARALLESSGLKLTVERDVEPLPVEIETALAMIIREATTNIQRHADARAARIEVRMRRRGWDEPGSSPEPTEVLLTVSDDGRGGITRRGTGLTGIGERVRSLGGTLEIDSPRGKGTALRARFPLDGAVQGDGSPAAPLAAVGQAAS